MTERPDQPGERACERALVWHLGQLRTDDNPALWHASQEARTVFPLVIRDPADSLPELEAYPQALQQLAGDYLSLGVHLCFLEGEAEEEVLDAARDARADHVYIAARRDEAGRVLLARAKDSLELWGFRCHIFYDDLFGAAGKLRDACPTPGSLSGHPLPSRALPEVTASSGATLETQLALGMTSPRRLWEEAPHYRERLKASAIKPIEGAGGIVFNQDGKVLLLRHKNGAWVFPKGHIDPGERKLDAALREVAEEAGIRAHCLDKSVRLQTRYHNDRQEERLIDWFLLITDAEAPICTEPLFPEGAFFEPAEALKLLTFPEDKRLLSEALAKRPSP